MWHFLKNYFTVPQAVVRQQAVQVWRVRCKAVRQFVQWRQCLQTRAVFTLKPSLEVGVALFKGTQKSSILFQMARKLSM
jgi:hypothetical protein